MKQLILLLLFLSIQLFAFPNDMWMRAKIIDTKDHIIVKALFNSYMADREEAKVKKIKPEFITHIIAKVENIKVYEAYTSGFVSKRPRIEFKVKKSLYGKTIKFIIVDNNGHIKSKSLNIKNITTKKLKMESESKLLFQNKRTNKPKVWECKTSKEAIEEFYGLSEIIDSGINIEFTDKDKVSIFNGEIYVLNPVRIRITSLLDLESIGIFVDGNPRSAVSILTIPKNGIIYYEIPIKIRGDSIITIIGKSRDGKLYKISKHTKAYIHG